MNGLQTAAGLLWRAGVHYLAPPSGADHRAGLTEDGTEAPNDVVDDLVVDALLELATSGRPREAEAVVAALLCRPDWAEALAEAVRRSPAESAARAELRYGYMAAAYLQRLWEPVLRLYWRGPWRDLPDLYSADLALPPVASEPGAAKRNVHVLAHRRARAEGADFLTEYDKVVHHLEGQWIAEGRLPAPRAASS